jgi:hypothetical protein
MSGGPFAAASGGLPRASSGDESAQPARRPPPKRTNSLSDLSR